MLDWADDEGAAADLKSDKYMKLLEMMAYVQMDRKPSGPQFDRKALVGSDEDIAHIEEVWENFLKNHTMQELYERSQSMGVALMPVYDASDLLNDPQLLYRNWFTSIEHPELHSTLTYPGAPYRFSKTPWRLTRRSPFIGEHNREIFNEELGISED
jgi:crotonobetainyl-CoA:carnitine CoA-transferase CaiB-like acyl-CoA transferase